MAQNVVNGAMMSCSFGAAPASLVVIPTSMVNAGGQPAANILDHQPMANIPMFGMCSSPTNPTVIAATAAKLGVFTPMPCVPATASPWVPGSPTVMVGGAPAVQSSCQLMCMWAGVITVSQPGQTTVNSP